MKKNLCMNCMSDIGKETVCPVCGHDNLSVNAPAFLPVKSTFANRFIIGKAYDANGEGVTYSAFDKQNETPVIIREYFPADIAARLPDGSVAIKDGFEFSYNSGLEEFIDISKKLAQNKDLPCLFTVLGYFEYGGTAYRIMESVSVISLMEFLLRNGGSLTWEQARPLFLPLISTLNSLHDEGIIHRGISPETVFVGRDGKLRLKNICIKAVRTRGSDISAQLYPGFAAIEQYGTQSGGKDGTWTDVYGLSATLFRVLAGNPPCDATDRINNDNMTIPSKVAESVPRHVLAALANGLQIMPEDRTWNVSELKSELTAVNENVKIASSGKKSGNANVSSKKYMFIAAGCTAAFFIIAAIIIFALFSKGNKKEESTSSLAVSSVSSVDTSSYSSYVYTEKKSVVPSLSGVSSPEAIKLLEENNLKYEIIGKEYNTSCKRGAVCKQSIDAGKEVEKDTVVKLTISLGSKSAKIPNLSGSEKNEAYIKLLELGFIPENIMFIDKYDETAKPEAVISTEPSYGSLADIDTMVKVYINTYAPAAVDDGLTDEDIDFD